MSARRQDVFVGVASIPSRVATLRKVIRRLLPQAGEIGVYLNGYDQVPSFLRKSRIRVERSQEHGDLRDNGKFFFLGATDAQYYAAVDDDLLYPYDYLEHLVRWQRETGPSSAVGVHAAAYPEPVVGIFEPRVLFHFSDALTHLTPVHLLGTGTALIDRQGWGLSVDEFEEPGMADVWFASAAARRGIDLYSVPRSRNWVGSLDVKGRAGAGSALYFEGLLDNATQTAALRAASPTSGGFDRLVASLLSVPKALDEFCLHQALHLDWLRMQLGYPKVARDLMSELQSSMLIRAEAWATSSPIAQSDAHDLGRLSLELLEGRPRASSIADALDVLDRLHAMFEYEPAQWAQLPAGARFDSEASRVGVLRTRLVDLGFGSDQEDWQTLWDSVSGRVHPTVSAAVAAAKLDVELEFERLPSFLDLARENPDTALARLYDYYEAVSWGVPPDVSGLRAAFGADFERFELQMLICMAAERSGQTDLARELLRKLSTRFPWDRDVILMQARSRGALEGSTARAMKPALRALDAALQHQGLRPFSESLADGEDEVSHWIQAFRSPDARPGREELGPSVSVLVTTFNDKDTIGPALTSVLESVDVRLEVIVVDDASTDGTQDELADIDDERVLLLRNETNVGPYVSRNRALEHAKGDYVAIADGDDWSHPQRLAYQASIMDRSPELLACKVAHLRLGIGGLIELENHLRFVGDGPVSLMFRRWLVDHIGGFDHVRTRGDIEFLRRVMARFGEGALGSFETPLILASSSASSNSKLFNEDVLNVYRSAARTWHERHALSDELYVPLRGPRPAFNAPYEMRSMSS